MLLRRLPLAALVLFQAGCFNYARRPPLTREEYRKSLGSIGIQVVPWQAPKKDGLPLPVTGGWTGFKRGAGMGFNAVGGDIWFRGDPSPKGGSSEGAYVYGGILALTLAASLTGGMVGSFMSLFKSVPEGEVAAARASILKALSDPGPDEALGRELTARQETAAPDQADAVLTVAVVHAGLEGRGGMDPDLGVSLTLAYELSARQPPRTLRKGSLGYENKKALRKFLEWGKDDARLLREELALAYPALAESVLQAAFTP